MSNYYEFAYILDAKNSNPNGDPAASNMPRQDPTTNLGWISDMCLKRKIRDYVAMTKPDDPTNQIYITKDAVLDRKNAEAFKALDIEGEANGKIGDVQEWMRKRYYDVRMVGAVMVGDNNAGTVRGPVQINMAESLDEIAPIDINLTRMAATKESEAKEGERDKDNKTMGTKWIVPYAAYMTTGAINGPLATKAGVSEADIDLFWEALCEAWHYDKAAGRGDVRARKLVVIKHPGEMRTRGTPHVDEIVTITRNSDEPRQWSDYAIEIDHSRLPEGVEVIEMI